MVLSSGRQWKYCNRCEWLVNLIAISHKTSEKSRWIWCTAMSREPSVRVKVTINITKCFASWLINRSNWLLTDCEVIAEEIRSNFFFAPLIFMKSAARLLQSHCYNVKTMAKTKAFRATKRTSLIKKASIDWSPLKDPSIRGIVHIWKWIS